MDLLLILTYTAICVVIFKVFKIPLNKWSVPTAVLGGIALIGTLILLMNYNHPFSEISRVYFVTTPIVPAVTGTVIEVPVTGNSKLKKGDVLFKIDPIPFENKLASITAQVNSAQIDVKRATKLLETRTISQREVDLAFAKLEDLTAKQLTAQFNLEQTVVRAPTDGYATQVALRPGMRAAQLPLRPVMVFVHDESHYFIGWYRQNSMLRLQVGDDAEVAFDGIPGEVFSGKVKSILPVIAEGQVQANGNLYSGRNANFPGRFPVWIDITDPKFAQYAPMVPGGAFAQSAIYTQHFAHVAIMRKILLRMASWMNFIFPFH